MTAADENGAFDGFESDGLGRWSVLEMPLGDGRVQRHADEGASVRVVGEVVEIDIPRFSLGFDGGEAVAEPRVRMIDGPKQMFVAGETFAIPERGRTRFAADVAAENHAGDPDDPRDAIATFNLAELSSGLVFDVAMSSKHVWAIRERLGLPHVAEDDVFTYLAESPFAPLGEGEFHRCEIELDPAAKTVRWLVDGERIYHAAGIDPFPREVAVAFAIITLHRQPDGRSTSIRGQGMRGRWRRFSHELVEA